MLWIGRDEQSTMLTRSESLYGADARERLANFDVKWLVVAISGNEEFIGGDGSGEVVVRWAVLVKEGDGDG